MTEQEIKELEVENEKVEKKLRRLEPIITVMRATNILWGIIAIIFAIFCRIKIGNQVSPWVGFFGTFSLFFVIMTYIHDFLFHGGFYAGRTAGFKDGLEVGAEMFKRHFIEPLKKTLEETEIELKKHELPEQPKT